MTDSTNDGRQIIEGDPDAPLFFHYMSGSNISFHGSRETGYTVGEWNEMTERQQTAAMAEHLWQLVEIEPSADEDFDPFGR